MDDNKIKKEDLNKTSPLGTARVAKPQPKGTGFTNIQSIIKANQGNRLGQAVAGGVQNQASQVRQNVQQAGQKFGQEVQAKKLGAADQEAATGIINRASKLAAGENLSDQEQARAQTYMSGDYQGPRDIENSAQLAGRAAEAEQLGRLGGTEAGRQGLLQRFVGAPQYSFGQQKLDNLLLGANQGALARARAATRGVGDQTISAIEAARGQAEEAAAGNRQFAKTFGEQAGAAYSGANEGLVKGLEAAKTAEVQAADAYGNFEQNLLKAYDPNRPGAYTSGSSAETAQSLINNFQGLSPEAKQQLLKVTQDADRLKVDPRAAIANIIGDYQGASGLTEGQFASQEQAARLNALAKLAGKDPMDFSQAGQYKAGQGQLNDQEALNASDALGQIENEYNNKVSNLEKILRSRMVTKAPDKKTQAKWDRDFAAKKKAAAAELKALQASRASQFDLSKLFGSRGY